jgi:glutamate N-acetyltransferase/amino-acid N-acetyltransferase
MARATPFPSKLYDQTPVAAHLKGSHMCIGVDLRLGSSRTTVWSCDLTQDHIHINADYRN